MNTKILGLCAALITALCLPAFADNDKDKHDNHGNNGHHYGQHKCDSRCEPPSQTNVVNLTNIVTVTRYLTNVVNVNVPIYTTNVVTVTLCRTNFHYCDIFRTNVVSVTNIVEASLDPASSNYTLSSNHVYKLYVLGVDAKWTAYGVIRSKTAEVVRVIVPGFLTRHATPLWQLVDVTVATNKFVVPAEAPVAAPDRAFVAMNHVLIRVIR